VVVDLFPSQDLRSFNEMERTKKKYEIDLLSVEYSFAAENLRIHHALIQDLPIYNLVPPRSINQDTRIFA
jgi:hypothetical protein